MSARMLVLGLLFVLGGSASSQAQVASELPPLDPKAAADVSYRHDVWPILKRHCWGCHSGGDPQGGLSMDSAAALAKGGESGQAVLAGQPDQSLVVQVLSGAAEPAMPKGKPPLAAARIHVLRQWILAGALDDTPPMSEPAVVIPEQYARAPAVTSLAFSPDGARLAAACGSEAIVIDWASDSAPLRLPTQSELLTFVDFSPDGSILCAAGGSPGRYGEARFFNTADAGLRGTRRIGVDTLFRGGFSPDGASIALGASDGAIYIIPTSGDAPERKLDLHSDWVVDVCYSLDGRLLISGGRDKSVKVSFVDTGKLVRSIASSTEMVNAVAATQTLAISAGRDRAASTYDLQLALGDTVFNGPINNETKPVDQSAQYTKRLEDQPGEILDIALSADRSLLAVAGDYPEARVYKTADNSRLATLAGLPMPVYALALSPDGTRLAAGGYDGTIRVFELPTGMLLKTLSPAPVQVAQQ